MNTPSTSVSPGLGAFVAFFLLAVALWLLMRNMNTRMRNLGYREEREARGRTGEASGTPPRDGGSGDSDQAGDGGDTPHGRPGPG